MGGVDKRYQIFVSSTFQDLAEQRKQAIEVIFERGHIPIALERFSASNESDLEVITRAIKDCQVYLLILGHRYGEIVPGRDISFTELEFEIAESNGLLVLPFILKQKEVNRRRRDELNPDNTRDKLEQLHLDKLETFHNRTGRFRQYWSPEDQFKFLVANALNDNLPRVKKPGLIWETNSVLTGASGNQFIIDIVEQLRSFTKLDKRVLNEAEKKHEVSVFFRTHYLDRIVNHKVGLFLESGSTLAYVAKEMSETLSHVVKIKEGKANIQISTNNVLAYLELWLKAKIPCTSFPWSPPKELTYGALYGGLDKIEEQSPKYDGSGMDDAALNEIDRLDQAFFSLKSLNSTRHPGLLLATASGLQLSDDHNLLFKEGIDEETQKLLTAQLSACFGPHVGSYRNKVFKRYMYSTGMPLIVFITEDKIDCPIEVGKCHFILDQDLTWKDFTSDYPVAFIVGCSQRKKNALVKKFAELGFEIMQGQDYQPITAFAARNKAFISKFEHLTDLRKHDRPKST
jgi:hypothetical protein